jgi:hypothetical protein
MQDILVQLDPSFDRRPVYILVAWLRHCDSQVTIGEPLAIIQDGDTRKVISAPCSGRVIAIYADPGAPLLPRSTIALIRPGLPIVIPASEFNNILIAMALIALALVIVPALNGIATLSTKSVSATVVATSTANTWWPFVDNTPRPTPAGVALTPNTPVADPTPMATTTPATSELPAIVMPPVVVEPPAAIETRQSLIKQMISLINEMVDLANEIRPWVQSKQSINPQIYQQMIQPRIVRNQKIIDKLHEIVNANSSNPAISATEQQLISQVDFFVSPCMSIYQEVTDANNNNRVPQDLNDQYKQCNQKLQDLQPFLSGQ